MKKKIFLAVICSVMVNISVYHDRCALAWDGFDSTSAELVEIIPDTLPAVGSSVEVHNYDRDSSQTCQVENITRNKSTIEVLVRTPDGASRLLVMEGR